MDFSRFSYREKEVLEKATDILVRELAPSRIILFGSRAKGTEFPGSDFDLGVDAARPTQDIEWKIQDGMDEARGLYKVDVVYLKDVEADFRNLILRTGMVVYGS